VAERPSNASTKPLEEPDAVGEDSRPGTDESAAADEIQDLTASVRPRFDWARLFIWVVLPGVAIRPLGAGAFLKWQDTTLYGSEILGDQALPVARQRTVALLSYRPDTVDRDLTAARGLVTGNFRDSYTKLTDDVVIPGAKQQRISAVAQVPAAATVSANANHAVVIVFINLTTVIGDGTPIDTASTVRVRLDKVGNKWMFSDFEPI